MHLWMGRECKYQAHFTSRAAKDVKQYFEKGIKQQKFDQFTVIDTGFELE